MLYPATYSPYNITSQFGNRIHPVNGVKHYHNGIDIASFEGDHIFAPEQGVVISASNDEFNGNKIKMQGESGNYFIFCHLKSFEFKNSKIKKGDLIARLGNTGRSTGPHLHLSVKNSHDDYINPGYLDWPKIPADLFMLEALRVSIDVRILYALHTTENGPKLIDGNVGLGVLTPNKEDARFYNTLHRQIRAAVNTIRKFTDSYDGIKWENNKYTDEFLGAFSAYYAPLGVSNDPDNLNKNHSVNLIKCYHKETKEK